MVKINSTGIISAIAMIGLGVIVIVLLAGFSGPLSKQILNTLNPRNFSFASQPGAEFVDDQGNAITKSTTNLVSVRLTSPWGVPTSDAALTALPEFINSANAQGVVVQEIEIETVPVNNSGVQKFTDSNASGGSGVVFTQNTSLTGPMILRSNPTTLTIRARGDQCFGAPKMAIYLDNVLVSSKDVTSTSWTDYGFTLNANPGTHKIDFSYTNERIVKIGNYVICDRNLRIDKVSVSGGVVSASPSPVASQAPSAAPSVSARPSPTVNPSVAPSIAPSPSAQPSQIPSPLPSANPSPIAGVSGFAIIGDSSSDEYRGDDNRGNTYANTTLNWMEQLVRKGVNFGPWSSTSRGEPRRKGYEYNFARSGARVQDVINNNQHASVRDLIKSGKISHVYIQAGANDAAEWNNTYQDLYNGTLSTAALQSKKNAMLSGYNTIMDTVKSGGNAKVIIATMPDVNLDPSVVARYPDTTKRKKVTDFISSVNAELKSAAAQRAIPVFDIEGFFMTTIAPKVDSQGNMLISGEKIDMKTYGDEPHHMVLSDKIHAGTVMNGLLANGIANMFNSTFSAGIPTLSEQEILVNSGIKAAPASATPAPQPKIASATIAEDSNFTQNVININPFTSNPMVVTYAFSGGTGNKTLYVKFTSTTGEQQTFTSQLEVVAPTASATPEASHGDHPGGGSGENSYGIGLWNPNPKFDTCPNASDTARIKEIHDSYKVRGPDGKWYPTWHPAVDPATGCKFGHEHGRDPSQSMVWQQVKEYFYFDANNNGKMDSEEEAVSGLPFGYTNEQFDVYNASKGINSMRHEDHVGHKVDWANGEPDIATHNMSNDPNGGVWIGDATDGGKISPDTGVRCFFLAKPHQGVSTKDAFTNNIHEVFYFQDCRHPSKPELNAKVSVAMMEGFGAPGGFTNFMPLCKIERRSNPQDLVCPLGKNAAGKCTLDSMNQNYPTDDGDREIVTRECVEKGFLVPQGEWSGNLYEAWPASLQVVKPNGTNLVSGINLLFDVEDANRYYWPGKTNNVGYTMELCYDQSLASQGRIFRGGPCDVATNYGKIKDITWDDPRSGFKGVNRGMYFQSAVIENGGGSQVWYTDPFGKNASTTPFTGSVKQVIEAKNIKYGNLIPGAAIDPRVNNRRHSDGNGTVHAPN